MKACHLPPKHPSSPALVSCSHLILSYTSTLARGIPPHPHAFPPLLKACASLCLLPLGLSLHQHAVIHGFAPDLHVSSSLIHMYSKNGHLHYASRIFDGMPARNVVPWSAIVAAYSRAGDAGMAFLLYNEMRSEGIEPNSVTMVGLLSGVSRLDGIQCLHGSVVRCGFETDLVLANAMLSVYAKCGRVEVARRLFDLMPVQDTVSWNSMIAGYSHAAGGGGFRESSIVVDLFRSMRHEGMSPDHQTFGSLVSAISNSMGGGGGGETSIRSAKSVHALITTSGYEFDAHVGTGLMSMYLRFGSWKQAFTLFDRNLLVHKDTVAWTAMMSGLVQNGRPDKALSIFHQMLRSGVMPATTTIASVLAACAQMGLFDYGSSVHGYVVRQRLALDVAAQNSLVSMYAKCGHLKQCRCIFEMMHDKDLVSWNAVVCAYAQNGDLDEAFSLFKRMNVLNQGPDTITVVSLLQACASMGALHHGRVVHNFIIRHGLKPCISMDTSLVDMYSKCGNLQTAHRCFDLMPEQDLVSWSAIIGGYGSHGVGIVALEMYSQFLQTGMAPNDVMFLSLLSACSHAGLVSEGLRIFKSIEEDHRLKPTLEHYGCIIDLLSRSGMVEDAFKFIKKMTPRPNADVLGILLDACRVNKNAILAQEVAKEIIALEPDFAENYVQLAHSYAAMSRWDSVGETWVQMRMLGLKKAPGWSFIELNGTITTFFAHHASHSQYKEMILLLETLDYEMREFDQKALRLTRSLLSLAESNVVLVTEAR